MLLNNNAFVYPVYDKETLEIEKLIPLNPTIVEPLEYTNNEHTYKLYFEDGQVYEIPIENIIHLKRFYSKSDFFGGNNAISEHDALLKTLKGIDKVVDIDWSSLSSANVEGPYKDLKKLNIMPNLSNMSLLDYFFAYTEQDTLILANTVFNNLEHARYTFFGAKIDHLDLSGCDFLKLKSAIRCFDNASIDTLDMTDVKFSDSMDFEDMFTNHKIRTLITDNPQVQQAFDRA